MKKIRHRIISIMMCIVIAFAYIPASTGIVKADAAINGGDISTTGLNIRTNVPTELTTYKAGNGTVVYDPATKTLTLNNATITANAEYGIELPDNDAITILAEGNSTVTAKNTSINHEVGDATIQGGGTLNLTNTIKDENGKLPFDYSGIHCSNGFLTITGDVTINADGMNAMKGIDLLGNSKVTVPQMYELIADNGIRVNTTNTVSAARISTASQFEYINGILTGSLIFEGKGHLYENNVYTVYGNVTLGNRLALLINKRDKESSLTVLAGATLTVPAGENVQVESGVVVTNNGIIENNGTIALPAGTTNEQIQAMKITGSGKITVDGIPLPIVNGVYYSYGGDIGFSGVDLSASAPSQITYYKAGDGYVLYNPSNATITLHDADFFSFMNVAFLKLPKSDITLVLEGTSTVIKTYKLTGKPLGRYIPLIWQENESEVSVDEDQVDEDTSPTLPMVVSPQNYKLIVAGNGTLLTDDTRIDPIFTDGTFVMKSGTIKPTEGGNFALATVDFKLEGGSIYSNLGIQVKGNANITGGTLITPGGPDEGKGHGMLSCVGAFNMSGGTVKCGAAMFGGLQSVKSINQTGGTLNAIVGTPMLNATENILGINLTVYGNISLNEYDENGNYKEKVNMYIGTIESIKFELNIAKDSILTIPVDGVLTFANSENRTLSDYVTNNGTLVNNGVILLPSGTTDEDVKEAVSILKPTGTGIIGVEGESTSYSNSGARLNVIDTPLDFSNGAEQSGDGYNLTGNATDGYTLEIENLRLTGNLTLPTSSAVNIHVKEDSVFTGDINFTNSSGYGAPCDLTINGEGTFAINGSIRNGCNRDIVRVADGIQLTVNGSISIGGSGGQDGTLNVSGSRTSLAVINNDGTAIYCDTVGISDGAKVYASSNGGRGIFAQDGGVTVTGGSTLRLGCDYGIYIIDGKLSVDSTSTLITNGSVAPFCIVDKTKSKSLDQVISLPGIPTGTMLTSVTGTDLTYGATYWSLVYTGNKLGVSNENSEPVSLSGAVKGLLSFAKASIVPANNSQTGGNSTVLSSDTGTTVTVDPVSASKSDATNTGDNTPVIWLLALAIISGSVCFYFGKKKKFLK